MESGGLTEGFNSQHGLSTVHRIQSLQPRGFKVSLKAGASELEVRVARRVLVKYLGARHEQFRSTDIARPLPLVLKSDQ